MNRVRTLVMMIKEKQHRFESLSEVTLMINQMLRVKEGRNQNYPKVFASNTNEFY